MAQQGPPPRRPDRPPVPGWQDHPSEPGWQDQPSAPPAWQDPQQAQPPVPGWQDQPAAPPAWQDPQAPQPGPGWADQATPPAPARHSQPPAPVPGWPGPSDRPPAPGWPDEPAVPAWPDETAAPGWPDQEAQPAQPSAPSWQDQPLRRRPATYNPDDPDDDLDEDTPPWAGLSVAPRRPRGSQPRRSEPRPDGAGDGWQDSDATPGGLTRRAIATRARKARRKLVIGGGVAIAVVILAAGGWELFGPKAATPHPGGFVNSFQPGELRTVPSSCRAISGTLLGQYLPGHPKSVATAALNGASESQCTWTLDVRPVYRVLEVTSQAFAPSGLDTGDGSATFGAIDDYSATEQALTHPAKHTHLPAATVTKVPGLGAQAFSALQVIKGGGNTTDLITLVVRDRNVVVTIAFQGLEHSRRRHYDRVAVSQLRAGSAAAAREVLAGLR